MDHFFGKIDEQMQCRGILHIVESGDTLYKIGKKYGVPVSRIMYANPYVNIYNLQIGDEICVPVLVPRMPAREERKPEQNSEPVVPMEQLQQGCMSGNTCTGQMGFTGNAPYADDGAYMGNCMEETLQDTSKEADQSGMPEADQEPTGSSNMETMNFL